MSRRLTLWLFLAVLAAAAGLRLWQINVIPPGFHFDESFEGLEAWRILTDPGYRPLFLTGNFGVPPLNAYANAVTFGIAQFVGGEAGPTAMRVTAALFGVLGVLAVAALAMELRHLQPGRFTAAFPLFAAALLATMRWHIHFSRIGIEPVLVPLEWTAATWLFLRGWRTQRWLPYAGCGVVLAATIYTYQGAWIIPFLMGPVVLVRWLHDRFTPATPEKPRPLAPLAGTLLTAAAAAILVAPLLIVFIQNPDLLFLRPSQIAVTSEQAATPQGPLKNMLAYLMMFVPVGQVGDLDPRRNLPGEAALNLWQALPFWLGMALTLWRIRQPAYIILLVGLIGLLLPGVFSEYAPHYHRVLGAAAPAALIAAAGLDALWRLWERRVTKSEVTRWLGWASVALLLAGALVSARDYFVRWATLPDLFYAFDVGLWEIGQDIAARPASETWYLTPRDASHPTLAFAWTTQGKSHGPPVTFDGRAIFPLTAGETTGPETYVTIESEDFRTRLLLPEVLPDARSVKEVRDRRGQTYATYHVRPPYSLPSRPPQHPLAVTVGDGIRLAGYDVQLANLDTGRILYVQIHWLVDAPPTHDWTVFTHLLHGDDQGSVNQVAGFDSRPGNGSLPTSRWQAGWRILDEYQITLPAELAPGAYQLEIGLYEPDGEQLPAGGAAIMLGDVTVE
ncbi:MAG: hypothetical protein H3C34_07900 [Caldilineaceae bacterium]|nr:hypothetical protein [Caldilineaceae bacterium]